MTGHEQRGDTWIPHLGYLKMVEFCAKCGAYIPPRQKKCLHCKPVESTHFEPIDGRVTELSLDDVLNHFPSSTFRRYQKEVIAKTLQTYQSGKKCIIVAAPTGFGKCLLPDQRVFTRKGLIRLADAVATDDPNFRTDAFSIGRSPAVRISTQHGYCLSGGNEHRIITFDGSFKWKKLSEVRVGDCVPIVHQEVEGQTTDIGSLPVRYSHLGPAPARIALSETLEEPLAELLGFYLADGAVTPRDVHIASKKENVRSDIAEIARRYSISVTFYQKEAVLNSVHVAKLFTRLVGAGAFSKKVPEQVFRAKEEVRIALLRGYFKGDGYYHRSLNVSEFYTVSYEIAQSVQLLLLSLGIFSTLTRKKGIYKGNRHLSWRVTVSGSQNQKFLKKLFGIIVTTDSASSWERIPLLSGKINRVLKEYVRRKRVAYRSNAYRNLKTMESYALDCRQPTRRTLLRYLNRMKSVADMSEYQALLDIAMTECLFDYVHGIEDLGEREVYELSCKNSTYVAQGFISHNSYVAAAFTSVTKSFYVTPQLALIDQLTADPKLRGRFVNLKGRQNYKCHYSQRRGVHLGKCVTEGYPCNERLDVCPYWKQKYLALQAPSVLMSLAYLILEGTTEGSETYLGTRDLLVLDEAHNLEEHCLNHVSLKFSSFSVPYEIYHKLLPSLRNVETRVELDVFLADVAGYIKLMLGRLETKSEQGEISLIDAENKALMERFLENYNLFMFSNSEWVWEIRNDQLLLQPVFAREFMKNLVWKRGEHYLISSATILDPEHYVQLNGLTDLLAEDEVEILEVPSTFPPENRPVIDATVGPLSMKQWDQNMPLAVAAIEKILRKEEGNVAIHCHGYRHQRALVSGLSPSFKRRLIVHSDEDREEKLQEWMRSRGKVFVSVAFNEGQDWKYQICSAQILLKAPYPDLSDKRVKRRLELGHRQWYRNQAMLEVIQAYGRAVRAEDDAARFYIVDGSCTDLIKSSWQYIPEWFKDALPSSFKPTTEN